VVDAPGQADLFDEATKEPSSGPIDVRRYGGRPLPWCPLPIFLGSALHLGLGSRSLSGSAGDLPGRQTRSGGLRPSRRACSPRMSTRTEDRGAIGSSSHDRPDFVTLRRTDHRNARHREGTSHHRKTVPSMSASTHHPIRVLRLSYQMGTNHKIRLRSVTPDPAASPQRRG
jgi:hypothetical protein